MRVAKAPSWLIVTFFLALGGGLLFRLLGCGLLTDDYHVLRFVTYGPETGADFDPDQPLEVLRYFVEGATNRFQLYRPLVAVSIRLSHLLHGLDPWGYHVENLLIHLLGGLLIWKLARLLFPDGSRMMAGLGLLLFLVHPLQVQVVAWTSARSDSLAWLLGATALYLQQRHRDRLWPALPFLAAALFCKETALVFTLAYATLELGGPGLQGRSLPRRLLGVAIAGLLGFFFLILRKQALGSVEEATYAGRPFSDFLGPLGVENIWISIHTAFGSATSLVIPEAGQLQVLRIVLGLLQFLLLGLALHATWKRSRALFSAATLLLVLPFVIASIVSRLDDDFVNTRSCYISLGAIALMSAALRPKPVVIAAFVLLHLLLTPVSQGLIDVYLEASDESERMVAELREAGDGLEREDLEDMLVLNYQEIGWFRGGFSFSGVIDVSVTRPFTKRDWNLKKIRADRSVIGFSTLHELATLFPHARSDVALVTMRRDEVEGTEHFERCYPPRAKRPGPVRSRILVPENGETHVLDAADPESLRPRYRISHPYDEVLAHDIYLMTRNGAGLRVRAKTEIVGSEKGRKVYELTLPPIPARLAGNEQFLGTALIGITILDADERVIEASPVTMFEIRGKP